MDNPQMAPPPHQHQEQPEKLFLMNLQADQLLILGEYQQALINQIANITFHNPEEDQNNIRQFVHYQAKLQFIHELCKFDDARKAEFEAQRNLQSPQQPLFSQPVDQPF